MDSIGKIAHAIPEFWKRNLEIILKQLALPNWNASFNAIEIGWVSSGKIIFCLYILLKI